MYSKKADGAAAGWGAGTAAAEDDDEAAAMVSGCGGAACPERDRLHASQPAGAAGTGGGGMGGGVFAPRWLACHEVGEATCMYVRGRRTPGLPNVRGTPVDRGLGAL